MCNDDQTVEYKPHISHNDLIVLVFYDYIQNKSSMYLKLAISTMHFEPKVLNKELAMICKSRIPNRTIPIGN